MVGLVTQHALTAAEWLWEVEMAARQTGSKLAY